MGGRARCVSKGGEEVVEVGYKDQDKENHNGRLLGDTFFSDLAGFITAI